MLAVSKHNNKIRQKQQGKGMNYDGCGLA